MEDVCRAARVNKTAVSRALNNKPGVNKRTRQRILDVVQKLGYTPIASAQNLRKRRTGIIGVVVPTFESAVFSRFIGGIEEIAGGRQYYIITQSTIGAGLPLDASLKRSMRLIDERRVDGLILFDSARASGSGELYRSGVPFVTIYQPDNQKVYSVLADNRRGAYEATGHLIEHGYQRIAMLTGLSFTSDSRERLEGYKKALQDHGIKVDPRLIVSGTFATDPSIPDFIRHFQNTTWPEAVFAANDEMALGLLHHTRNHKDRKVRATAIIGFDDIDAAQHVGLTTVRVDIREVGMRAARMLFELIDGMNGVPKKQTVPSQLIIRASCGCFAPRP